MSRPLILEGIGADTSRSRMVWELGLLGSLASLALLLLEVAFSQFGGGEILIRIGRGHGEKFLVAGQEVRFDAKLGIITGGGDAEGPQFNPKL